MKPTHEWDENYIYNIPPGEHDWVEFKGNRLLDLNLPGVDANKVLDELSKQISAFSNSGGGVIVYGIKDLPVGRQREVDNGGISSNIKGSTKEWLEDVIPNLVELPLSKFNVYAILKRDENSRISENKCLIIIEIYDSEQAPHQARDKRYYARVGGKSRPIGHKLVSDIFGRHKYPKMGLTFRFEKDDEERFWLLKLFCKNTGRIYANYVNGFIYIPSILKTKDESELKEIEGKQYQQVYFSNIHKDLINYKPGLPSMSLGLGGMRTPEVPGISYYVTRYEPVLPNLYFSESITIVTSLKSIHEASNEYVYWEIYADNSPVERGKILIKEINIYKR